MISIALVSDSGVAPTLTFLARIDVDVDAPIDLGAGEGPVRIYFPSSPRMSSASDRWAWLSSRILVARGERTPTTVALEVFTVD